MKMFGIPEVDLTEGLERLRQRLCLYGPHAKTCDCKFGASGIGEHSGCPELRQAIQYLKGHDEEVDRLDRLFEKSAVNTLAEIRRIVERHDGGSQ